MKYGNESRRKLRVVIYARYSSDMQREESIDAQIRYCKKYMESYEEYELVEIYYDEAKTAKEDIENREHFQRMIADGKDGHYDIILVHKFNRFARNKLDSAIYKKKLRDIGIRVISASQAIEDTPEGRMMESLIEAMDEYYSENLGLEVIKGLKENAFKGRRIGSMAPLGFYYDEDGKLREDKSRSHIVKEMFDLYLEGYGKLAIANKMSAKGYRGLRGKSFSDNAVSKILRNEAYTGTFTCTIGGEEIRIENNHDVIIDIVTFNKAQEIAKKRADKPRLQNNHTYSLTGKMRCGICGGGYVGSGWTMRKNVHGNKVPVYSYRCTNRRVHKCYNHNIRQDEIENYISTYVINRLLNRKRIDQIAEKFEEILNEFKENRPTETIDYLRKEKSNLESQSSKLLDLYLDPQSPIDKDTLKQRMDDVKRKLSGIESEIKSYYVNESFQLTKDDAVNYLRKFKRDFDDTDTHMVKAIIDTFVKDVIVKKSYVLITFNVDLNPVIHQAIMTDENEDGDEPSFSRDIDNSLLGELVISQQHFKESVPIGHLSYYR